MKVGPEQMSGDACDFLDANDVLSGDPIPLEDGGPRKAEFAGDLGSQAWSAPENCRTFSHKACLPSGSGRVKAYRLPPDGARAGKFSGMEIGDRIRKARLSTGMSQRELAKALRVSHGLVGAWESHIKAPGRETLRKLAEVTMTDPAAILSDVPAEKAGVVVTSPRHLLLIRRFDRMTRRQQENLLELLGVAPDVIRELQKESHPAQS